jgi:uncharacterized membrane protein YkvI
MGLRGDDDVALHVHMSSISLSHIFLKTLFDNFTKFGANLTKIDQTFRPLAQIVSKFSRLVILYRLLIFLILLESSKFHKTLSETHKKEKNVSKGSFVQIFLDLHC